MSSKSIIWTGIGILICLPLLWNYLQPKFFHLHDWTHVARLAELERGVVEGQLPVRWSANLGYGYGMPQFSFYGSLFYYFGLIFRTVGLSYVWSIKLTAIFITLLAYWGLFKLGSLLWGKWAGLLVAVAGTYAPYRMVDLYVRGAFGELSGITFFILTFYAIVLWSKKPVMKNSLFVVISGAGILLSHNLMALISAPFIFIWAGYWIIREKRIRTHLVEIIGMCLLTVGLSAFYVLPAFLEKDYTLAEKLTTGYSNYNLHFLYIRQFWNSKWGYGGSIWGTDDNISFQLGKVQIVLTATIAVLSLVKLIRRKYRAIPYLSLVIFFMLGTSLFLTIMKSKFIWDIVELFAYIQFPWRFLSVAMVFIALGLGLLKEFVSKKSWPIVSLLLAAVIIGSQVGYARPESFLDSDDGLYYADSGRIRSEMSEVIPDFLPTSANPKELPIIKDESERFSFIPNVEYGIDINRGHEFSIVALINNPSRLKIGIFDFPGWTIYVDGDKVKHSISPEGLIQLDLMPKSAETRISGKFEETPLRKISNLISVASLFVCISIFINHSYVKAKK